MRSQPSITVLYDNSTVCKLADHIVRKFAASMQCKLWDTSVWSAEDMMVIKQNLMILSKAVGEEVTDRIYQGVAGRFFGRHRKASRVEEDNHNSTKAM